MNMSVSERERLIRVEEQVYHARSDLRAIHDDLTTLRDGMVQLVDITARLDERLPQQPSKKQLASLGTLTTMASVVIGALLQQFGITPRG